MTNKKQIKFLIIAPRFHTNLYYRAISLQNAGHKVKVLVLYKGKSEYYKDIDIQIVKLSFFNSLIIKVISLFKKNKLKSDLELRIQSPNRKLYQRIKAYKPDVILLKAYQNMLALKTLFITKRFNIKVLMLTQTTYTHIKGSKFLFRINIKFFKFLGVHSYITPIKSNYDAFKNFGINNVYYLPFVFPVGLQEKEINKTQKIKILSIAKFVKRKDQLLLLRAINKLIKKEHKIELTLIGEIGDQSYFEQINRYIKEHSLLKIVTIKLNLDYPETLKHYAEHDIFILPAYSEPAAYSPVEALANGLPVICSDQNGTKCYIEEGENGYVFEAKNVDDLTKKICLLINDKAKLTAIKEKIINLYKKNHQLNRFKENILNII